MDPERYFVMLDNALKAVFETIIPIVKVAGAGAVSGCLAFPVVERFVPRGVKPHWKRMTVASLTGVMNWLVHAGNIYSFGAGPQGWAGVGFASLSGLAVAFLIHDYGDRVPVIGRMVTVIKRNPVEVTDAKQDG